MNAPRHSARALVLVLAMLLFSGQGSFAQSQSFGILRELWPGLSLTNNGLEQLTNTTFNPNWPDHPTNFYSKVRASIETETNLLDGYGQRLRGFIVPPMTGPYSFWIASDATSSLSVSTDEDPAHAALIAQVSTSTDVHQWDKDPTQHSSPLALEAGRRYYLEVLHKAGSGSDHLSVRWQLPDGSYEEPITHSPPGTRLIPFRGSSSLPGISTQPTNTTVIEGRSLSLSVLSTNQGVLSYQWQQGGVNLAGTDALKSVYFVPVATVAANNAQGYRCVLTSSVGSTTSLVAQVTVTTDTTPPALTNVVSSGLSQIILTFSEPVGDSALTPVHYGLSSSIGILSAQRIDAQTILLRTESLTEGSHYFLGAHDITDLAPTPNLLDPATKIEFIAHEFLATEIGKSTPAGNSVKVDGGWNITGGGGSLGGKSDQFHFESQRRTGDFDLRVRTPRFQAYDIWSRAGLVARETVDPGSRFAGAFVSSGTLGCFFESRSTPGATAVAAGQLPANGDLTWLRLKRSGTRLTGYASYDGESWVLLGQSFLGAGSVLVGLAVESHSPAATAYAEFRDLGDTPVTSKGTWSPTREPLGPSSRKTGLIISEIHYAPAPRLDATNLEFIEIYNSNPFFEDLDGYQIAGLISYTFPSNTRIPANGFLVLAASPSSVQSTYGITNVAGAYTGSLSLTPGLSAKTVRLQLLDATGAVLLDVPYSDLPPWPTGASGTGHSIVLARPSLGEGDPEAWSLSDHVGGSPGRDDMLHIRKERSVRINEFLAHSDTSQLNYIELYNAGTRSLDISGLEIEDPSGPNRFTIPPGSQLAAGGLVTFDQTQLGFLLPAAGGELRLWSSDHQSILDSIGIEAQSLGVASGRWPDGAKTIYPLATRSPGASNAMPRIDDIVIHEIMYNPISGNNDDEFVELLNKGATPVDLSKWKFTSGITYSFPKGTLIAPGAYLVVARNRSNLFAHYPQLSAANTVGNFSGKLPHGGRLALARPESLTRRNTHGVVVTSTIYPVVDEVTYDTGGRWGSWANGGGSSLELIDPHSNHRLASNWHDSDDTAKSEWVNIETFGQLDNGQSQDGTISRLQVGILDAGEALVDEIELHVGTNGVNYVKNPGFESGTTSWDLQGCHLRSSVEDGGYLGGKAMHLRCSDRIWTGANSVQGTLNSNPLGDGKVATLRFKARWMRGWPEVLLRLNGSYLETTGALPIPTNLGSPGLPNGTAVKNAGPAMYEVTHTPSLPAAGQSVAVTARVHDPDGIATLLLHYRIDPSTNFTVVPLTDDGAHGDGLAGDGIFTAMIPGQSANVIAAFYIEAVDSLGNAARFPALRNDHSLTTEALVMFGDSTPSSSFGVYHLWVSKEKSARWAAQPNLSNESWEGTFVYGNRVIYDMLGRFSGSPYHQNFDRPDGAPCHYKWIFNDDDKFLGATSFNKIHQPGNGAGDDNTMLREQTGYWLLRQMGLPWNYRRMVHVFVNGVRRTNSDGSGMMEDTQTPDGDVVKERYPNDSGGWLFKLQPWFEFDPSGTAFNNNSWNTVNNYTTLGGGKKLARYRWNYLMRRTPGSANDYSKVYDLVDAVNLSTNNPVSYSRAVESIMDVEQWIRTFAVEHSVGNWDSVGNNNGQNMYGYVGQTNRWNLLVWDLNILLGSSTTPDGPTGDDLFKLDGNNTPMSVLVNFPKYRRAYWRAYQELIDNFFVDGKYSPLMDAKYAALSAEGVGASAPQPIKDYMTQRLAYLKTQLNSVKTTFAVSTNRVVATDGNMVTLSGTAPVQAATLQFNGIEWPIIWITPTTWRIRIIADLGVKNLTVQGYDLRGGLIASMVASIQIINSNTPPSALGTVVINEVMNNPAVPGDTFVEILNTSSTYGYDLSGWRLDGTGYVFPAGSFITNGQPLVLARDHTTVPTVHGLSATVFDVFPIDLPIEGGKLALVQPGITPDQDIVVSRVHFESRRPWPQAANGAGGSLQLIDPTQGSERIGNWGAVDRQWQQFKVTTHFTGSKLQFWLDSIGDVLIDDIAVVAGDTAGVGPNLVHNGDLESPTATNAIAPWFIAGNAPATSGLGVPATHSGTNSLWLSFGAAGSPTANVYQDLPSSVTNGICTLSFWYLPNFTANGLFVRVGSGSSAGFRTNVSARASLATPGRPNSLARPGTAIPPLWLNEVQSLNARGITDTSGGRKPWVELYNSGATSLDLTGFTLSDADLPLNVWTFPSGAALNAGEFRVVFVDGHPELSNAREWHAGFVLSTDSGSVLLSRPQAGGFQIVDYLNYDTLQPDQVYGDFPDGQAWDRGILSSPTPGAPNTPPAQPSRLVINEWMSDNLSFRLNGTTGKFDDWFEIYNPGDVAVPLSGLYLSSSRNSPLSYLTPPGFIIAPHGFLMVWCDNGNGKGNTPGVELHTNFRLPKTGGTLGIYAIDGAVIDQVNYAAQGSNQADGRCPDGGNIITPLAVGSPNSGNECSAVGLPPSVTTPPTSLIHRGQKLALQVLALDLNSPALPLKFALGSSAPAGAAVQPQTGLLTWNVPLDAALGLQPIEVIVTTTSAAPLSTRIKIPIDIVPSLSWNSVTVTPAGLLQFSFSTIPGKTYRIEYQDSLGQSPWTPLGTDMTSTSLTITLPVPPTAAHQRFYRVTQIN